MIMKTLFLVRHAKSSWDYPDLSDADRPLNKRGERDAPEMGRRLRKRGISPDVMLTSPANRAQSTCEIIADAIKFPHDSIKIKESIYHAGEGTLLKVIKNLGDDSESAMIFGHNPGFTYLANRLANESIDNIPTCGVFSCSFEVDSWQQVEFGKGKTLFFDYPKKSK